MQKVRSVFNEEQIQYVRSYFTDSEIDIIPNKYQADLLLSVN